MKVDGVSFNEEAIRKKTRKEFIDGTTANHWPGLTPALRKKKLGEIYDLIVSQDNKETGEENGVSE